MMPTEVMTLEPATPLKEIIAAVIGLVAVGLGVAALTATCEALLAAFFGAHHRAWAWPWPRCWSLPSPKGGSVCVI